MKFGLNKITYKNIVSGTSLLQTHNNSISFCQDKINVVIGPNGSGKSTLLKDLAARYMAFDRGVTCLDTAILNRDIYKRLFTKKEGWYRSETFMRDIDVVSANCAACYWSPNFNFGGWEMLSAALMSGYYNEAKLRYRHTREKSSGEGIKNQLDHVMEIALTGQRIRVDIPEKPFGELLNERLRLLKPLFKDTDKNKTIVLLDEPEQSLDILNEMKFWDDLLKVNLDDVQLIVATHSMYPLVSPKFKDKLNCIEAVAGYSQSVIDQWSRVSVC